VVKKAPLKSDDATINDWRKRVEAIPSLFLRLLYFSSLRETPDGLFFDPELVAHTTLVDEIIRREQAETFSQFLGLGLDQIADDLVPYLTTFSSRRESPRLLEIARELIPVCASTEDTCLFLGTMKILDTLLKKQQKRAPGGSNS
jgi:hypothetical protein